MENNKERDWIGYSVSAGEHRLQVTGKWEKDKSYWWWKCADCDKASGIFSTIELERLDERGLVKEPDGKKIREYSGHPTELNTTGHTKWCYDWD